MGLFFACEHGQSGSCSACDSLEQQRRTTYAIQEQTRQAGRAADQQTAALRAQAVALETQARAAQAMAASAAEQQRTFAEQARKADERARDEAARRYNEEEAARLTASWNARVERVETARREAVADRAARKQQLVEEHVAATVSGARAAAAAGGVELTAEQLAEIARSAEHDRRWALDRQELVEFAEEVERDREREERMAGMMQRHMNQPAAHVRPAAEPEDYGIWRPTAGFFSVLLALYGISSTRPVVPVLIGIVVAAVWAVAAVPALTRAKRYPGPASVAAAAMVVTALVTQFGEVVETGPADLVACLLVLALAGAAHFAPYASHRAEPVAA